MPTWVNINNKVRCARTCTCCYPPQDTRLAQYTDSRGVAMPPDMPNEIMHCVFNSVRLPYGHWHYRTGMRNPETGETKHMRDYFFKIVPGKWGAPEVTQWWEIEP